MTFSEAVTSVTRTFIVPKAYDTVTRGSVGLLNFLQKAKSWKTGYAYEVIIKYRQSTNGGNVGIADQLNTDRQNVRTKMVFNPHMTTYPVVVADIETTLNRGEEQVLDLLDTEFDSQAQSLMGDMAQNLYTGTGVGNDYDSLANAADDGTNYPNYGGLSRSTFPTIKGYYIAALGAVTLAKLATMYDAVEIGTDKPSGIMFTKPIWTTYESLLTPTVRAGYTQNGFPMMNAWGLVPQASVLTGGTQGFEVLFFRGTPAMKDEQVPSGNFYMYNENYFGFKGINIIADNVKQLNFKQQNDGVPQGVPGRVPSTLGFNFRDLMHPVNQLAEIGHLIYAGDFISENPRLNGHATGAN